jgi:CRISPR-associated protein Cmr2
MSAHLLAASIGPVQEFIAAARRTRDLWFGSHVLSEISKAAAAALTNGGATLIFPASGSDLTPDSPANVVNVLIAEVPAAVDARDLAKAAKESAGERWRDFADKVFDSYRSFIEEDTWNDQIDDVVEFYSAWTPLTHDYRASRAAVMRLLAGRKNLRDFEPARGREGVPKSSLDGARESVLRKNHPASPRLRLNPGEQLDAI